MVFKYRVKEKDFPIEYFADSVSEYDGKQAPAILLRFRTQWFH